MNPTQVQRSLDAIRHALRQMMEELHPPNAPWFAELFTDLLLQIGLVPMQETDADILKNVADKDKLQVRLTAFFSHYLILALTSYILPSPMIETTQPLYF